MGLRADHVAGAAFVIFGVLIIALSGDLPFGNLAMPGAGFLPVLIATLLILFGLTLFACAGEGPLFTSISWQDGKHAVPVILITAVAIILYERLGFIATMLLMMLGLLVAVERRGILPAAIFSIGVILVTYGAFEYVLKTPLVEGPFGF